MRKYYGLILGLLGLMLMVYGLQNGEWKRVSRWANTLCTACIGLTNGGH